MFCAKCGTKVVDGVMSCPVCHNHGFVSSDKPHKVIESAQEKAGCSQCKDKEECFELLAHNTNSTQELIEAIMSHGRTILNSKRDSVINEVLQGHSKVQVPEQLMRDMIKQSMEHEELLEMKNKGIIIIVPDEHNYSVISDEVYILPIKHVEALRAFISELEHQEQDSDEIKVKLRIEPTGTVLVLDDVEAHIPDLFGILDSAEVVRVEADGKFFDLSCKDSDVVDNDNVIFTMQEVQSPTKLIKLGFNFKIE